MELPVHVRWKSREGKYRQVEGKTASISGNGMLLSVSVHLRDQTPVEIAVLLPIEVTRVPLELLCQGRAVRQNPATGPAGIGAIIDDYQFRPAPKPVWSH